MAGHTPRRCNTPKARQGWNKAAMREARVRMCAGCDRMLPARVLIRIARLNKQPTARDGDEETSTKNHDDTEEKQKKQEKKKKNSHVIAVDASTLPTPSGDCTLLEMVAPGGEAEDALGGDASAVALAARALARCRRGSACDDQPMVAAPVFKGEAAAVSKGTPSKRGAGALQGRATYVCPRGFCARRAASKGGFARSLHTSVGGKGGRFNEALIALCDAAERLEGRG